MAEHDGLTRTPILVKNLNAAFCLNRGHEHYPSTDLSLDHPVELFASAPGGAFRSI
jgi:hypothetical protein